MHLGDCGEDLLAKLVILNNTSSSDSSRRLVYQNLMKLDGWLSLMGGSANQKLLDWLNFCSQSYSKLQYWTGMLGKTIIEDQESCSKHLEPRSKIAAKIRTFKDKYVLQSANSPPG